MNCQIPPAPEEETASGRRALSVIVTYFRSSGSPISFSLFSIEGKYRRARFIHKRTCASFDKVRRNSRSKFSQIFLSSNGTRSPQRETSFGSLYVVIEGRVCTWLK